MGTIVPRVLNYLLLTPFYTNIFKQNEFGVITELYAYVAFLLVLLTYGMETTYFRFSESEKNPNKVFNTALSSLLGTTIIFLLFIFTFSGSIAQLINYQGKEWYIMILAIIISFDAITAIPFAKLRRQNKAKKFALIKFTNISVNIGLNLYFLILCPKIMVSEPDSVLLSMYNPEIGVGYAFISNLAASLITLIMLLPEMLKFRFDFQKGLYRKMINYALPLLIVGLAGMVNEVADKIMLKFLVDTGNAENSREFIMSQIGIYGANYKLAMLMILYIQMFKYAAEPFFFAQAKEKNSKQSYAEIMKYFILFGLLIFLGVMLFIDLVKYIIGKDFHEGLAVVPVVLLANLFFGIFYNLSVWYKLTNKTKSGAVMAIIGALVTILLNVILVPVIGYMGAAWATFFCFLSMMVVSYFWGKKVFPVPYDMKSIGIYFGLAIAIYFLSIWIKSEISVTLHYTINSILFIVFLTTIIIKEKLYTYKFRS